MKHLKLQPPPQNQASWSFRKWLESITNAKFNAEWKSWTPNYGAGGSMTFTSVTTTLARYYQVGNLVFFSLQSSGTTGGSASGSITFTLPVTPKRTEALAFMALLADNSQNIAGQAMRALGGGSVVTVMRYDSGNFTLMAGEEIRVSGFFEIGD